MTAHIVFDAETRRLQEDARREKNWKRWGPYLAERQWATVREDYSEHGTCWEYFPHEHARSRVYRWGEDGLCGFTDRQCRLCFSLALWNGQDGILKERLFGLTGNEGNHGEDVKELYYYLESTPTHSYVKSLYKYPQAGFPYQQLLDENRRRTRAQPEYEVIDTGVFDEGRYFDVFVEYAKAAPEDICIRITVANRGAADAPIDVIPQVWYRNTWAWGRSGEGYGPRPSLRGEGARIVGEHFQLGKWQLVPGEGPNGARPELLFCENETNSEQLWGTHGVTPFPKDAFHRYVVKGEVGAVNPAARGTKAGVRYPLVVPARGEVVIELRLSTEHDRTASDLGADFAHVFATRIAEGDDFFRHRSPDNLSADEARLVRQSRAGLLQSKQFYHYDVRAWLEGDPAQPAPPETRTRNKEWAQHLYNRDVISMPDKWEYPWYAAWDLAFHMIPMAEIDPDFAKEQLVLFLREWYMHPSGQIPAYEFAFGDVNPPVHAWAVWRVYKLTAQRGGRDRVFLSRCFHKLLLNFTWWVNRKDHDGNNIFGGGFLGMDNIGVFDRSQPLPTGGHLEQADGTAWMAFYCANMLAMAFELAHDDPAAEDLASKFFEHFIAIIDAMNSFGGHGLWDERDGFYYDQLHVDGKYTPMRIRSLVGLIPLITCEVLEEDVLARMPDFRRRMEWLLANRAHLAKNITWTPARGGERAGHRLLAIPSRERLIRALRYVVDETEFLSPYGVRSLSRYHKDCPFVLTADGREYRVDYVPGDSTTGMFGGNSNWRGPIWFPINYLLIEALERYHFFYGETLRIECPARSGNFMNLREVALEISQRLTRIFMPDDKGVVPVHGPYGPRFAQDPHFRELLQFNEYFHADKGWGQGADHQTGWTALVARCVERLARERPSVANRAGSVDDALRAESREDLRAVARRCEEMKTLLIGNDDSTLEAMQMRLRARGLVVVRRRELVASSPVPSAPVAADFQLVVLIAVGEATMTAEDSVRALRQVPGGDVAVLLVVVSEKDTVLYERLVDAGASDFLIWPRDSELVPARLAALEERARQRRRERTARREAEAHHQGVLDGAPVMLYTTDGEGRLTSVSNRWCEVLGYSRQEVLGRMSLAFQSEAGRFRFVEEILPELFDRGEVRDVPHELLRKDGTTVALLLSAVAERDESGQLERSIVVLIPT